MRDEKETKERLLECAAEEFKEKGYQKASLRTICGNAGVTTGALYFFFNGKEDLYSAIIEPTLEKVRSIARQHVKGELELLQGAMPAIGENIGDDKEATQRILHVLYENYDICQMILTKSQGSDYENVIDEFVNIFEEGQKLLAIEQARILGVKVPDDYILHWVIHIQMDAFVQVLLHERDEMRAMKHMGQIVEYLTSGWKALFTNQQ